MYKKTKYVKKIEKEILLKGYRLEDIEDIHWEPWGMQFEMCGIEGGWFVNFYPIGLNIDEACDFIKQFGINLRD